MPSNIKNLEQTTGSLQARIDELEAVAAGVMDIGSVDNSGSDVTSWSGEVFFNGRRYYDTTLWDDGNFGDNTTGTAIANAADVYIKISLDPATAAASVVSYQTESTHNTALAANSGLIHLQDAMWYNIRGLTGALYADYPFNTISFWSDNIDKDTVRVYSGYVFIGGHTGPVSVAAQSVNVTTTGHCWLQVLRSNPVSAGVSTQ